MKKLLFYNVILITIFLSIWCPAKKNYTSPQNTETFDYEARYQQIEKATKFKPYVINAMLGVMESVGISSVTKAIYGENDMTTFLDIQCETGENYRLYLEETGYIYAIEDLTSNKLIFYIVE